MKKYFALLFILASWHARSQDIPLFSQKLTNSFLYNPSMAGQGFGSVTLARRNNYSAVEGAPNSTFLSVHSPIGNHRFGIGGNFFQEEVTAIRNMYVGAAFAYHLRFSKFSSLSFGVGGEYNKLRLSPAFAEANTGADPILSRYQDGFGSPDFSFGVSFRTKWLQGGIAANRLKSAWIDGESSATLSAHYSAYLQGTVAFRRDHVLEPYVSFRKFNAVNNVLDLGLFYTYNERLTLGLSTRSGNIASATLGCRVTKNMMIGYSREMILSPTGGYAGSSNELVLRVDFLDRTRKQSFRADYRNAVTYRRKVQSKFKSPSQFHRAQKKLAPFSPNARYQTARTPGKQSSYAKYPARKKPGKSNRRPYNKRR